MDDDIRAIVIAIFMRLTNIKGQLAQWDPANSPVVEPVAPINEGIEMVDDIKTILIDVSMRLANIERQLDHLNPAASPVVECVAPINEAEEMDDDTKAILIDISMRLANIERQLKHRRPAAEAMPVAEPVAPINENTYLREQMYLFRIANAPSTVASPTAPSDSIAHLNDESNAEEAGDSVRSTNATGDAVADGPQLLGSHEMGDDVGCESEQPQRRMQANAQRDVADVSEQPTSPSARGDAFEEGVNTERRGGLRPRLAQPNLGHICINCTMGYLTEEALRMHNCTGSMVEE